MALGVRGDFPKVNFPKSSHSFLPNINGVLKIKLILLISYGEKL
jgi:hypothetical protein